MSLEEVSVTRKGQVTIPVKYRRKYGITEGTKVLIEDAEGGIFLRPLMRLEEQAGIDAGKYNTKELKKSLDKVRREWR
ncbi:MAG: AbrB/MazE/SpoVT family DNA-binding domain-containing protein [Thermoproteota archaeon]|nr:AbrB/MazE/SpoVT family DNA-binding domain-containing protein [Thermoproteota archaeon]